MNKMKDAGTSKREHAVMEKIKEAHRRVMVANHPHKGGSMYLAKNINEAEVLLMDEGRFQFFPCEGLTDVDDPIPRSSNGLSEEISFKILKQVWVSFSEFCDFGQHFVIIEVISRNVLVDECSRQVVEVEQATMWKFLWWSGIIAVHVMVGQSIDDHSLVDVLYAECLHLSLCEGRTHAGCCNNLTRYMLEHFDSDSVIRITGDGFPDVFDLSLLSHVRETFGVPKQSQAQHEMLNMLKPRLFL
ncbi:hypothetical protein C5167_040551 [Papaver somniferum]|uniref:Uncharacterized protein n=1 Tax=Papaver somniferum TaxID=3469 RepID=A0A4Y7IF96_PAPSO|nr:hypothetical protein C5167_040551 [Papaver somniferum]